MTTQENAKRKRSNAQIADQTSVSSETSLIDLGLPPRVRDILNGAGLKTVQDVLDKLAQGEAELLAVPGVGPKTLEEIRMRLAKEGLLEGGGNKMAELEEKQQIPDEAEWNSPTIEQIPTKVEETGRIEDEYPQSLPPVLDEESGIEQRVSFIVRLTIDKQGQPRRTEVEHAQSTRKTSFPGLDIQRLAAFMETCLGMSVIPEPAPVTAPPLESEETIRPASPGPNLSLTISDVQIAREQASSRSVLILNTGEGFTVRVRFQIQGSEAPSLSAEEVSYEIEIYARELTSSTSRLLTRYKANLAKNLLEYTSQIYVAGLSPGFYRLDVMVTLQAPFNLGDYYNGPIFRVRELQPSAEPATLLKIPLPH